MPGVPLERLEPGACAYSSRPQVWAPRRCPSGRSGAASACRAACVSCGFRPRRRTCPPGARPAFRELASRAERAAGGNRGRGGGGEAGVLAVVCSPGGGDLGRRCWEL